MLLVAPVLILPYQVKTSGVIKAYLRPINSNPDKPIVSCWFMHQFTSKVFQGVKQIQQAHKYMINLLRGHFLLPKSNA